ncbi:MAG: c-type cytochrome [Burkholderiales bacterium]
MTKQPRRLLIAALLLAATVGSFAQDAQRLRARSLAATCAPCHGTDGHAVDSGAVPGLAGMPAGYLAEQMHAFKSGARSGSVMPQLAKGFSDAQIGELAAWFAQAPKAK